MMIECLIVEDEPNAAKLIRNYISKIPSLQLKGVCRDGESAIGFLAEQPVELIFMDIHLPEISGLELAKACLPAHIIFTTAYSEFAVESYNLNAIDYLLKPISFSRFSEAAGKASQIIANKKHHPGAGIETEDFIFLKTGKKIIALELSTILYFEGLKEYVAVVTATGKHLVYKRMKQLESVLPSQFVRLHNSFIANMQAVQKIEDNHVYIGSKRIPVSQKYKAGFIERVNKKLL